MIVCLRDGETEAAAHIPPPPVLGVPTGRHGRSRRRVMPLCPAQGLGRKMLWLALLLSLGILDAGQATYSTDLCSWRGSGLSQEPSSVEQISLHCGEGSLEWLYPSGALRLSFSPRLPLGTPGTGTGPSRITACIKPASTFRGAQAYLERDGILELLLSETDLSLRPRVHCFSWLPHEKAALFLQSTPHQDISRRIAGFRYELRGDWNSRLSLPLNKFSVEGVCRPCNDTEILMAVCTSDFVIRGNIRTVSNDAELQESVISVTATKIHRQKFTLFQPVGNSVRSTGNIRTLLRCGVKPGPGSFLFMGWVHFGEAWLGCAPRHKDFRRVYEAAQQAHENPCEVVLD